MALFNLNNGKLEKMESLQSSESRGIQVWLADHPELLGGDEMDHEDPRRFLLIKREVHDSSGSLDHLFIDQEGIPTFVEAKLSENPESRRKVVGQLLDYASQAALSWTARDLEGWLEERCQTEGLDKDEVFLEFESEPAESHEFWRRAEENLRSGNVRLMFACDEVPSSLQRIVEFLNERMNPTEVLALEVQCLQAGEQTIFSSTIIGATERAQAAKGRVRKPNVLGALLENGTLHDGQELWLTRETFPARVRPARDDDPRLRITLKVEEGGQKRFVFQKASGESLAVVPSSVFAHVRRGFDSSDFVDRSYSVHNRVTTSPGGKTLGELAEETGAWPAE